MRVSKKLRILAMSLGAVGMAQNAEPTFSIAISADRTVCKPGEDIKVKDVLTNSSDRPFGLDFFFDREAYLSRLIVRDEAGNLAEEVVWGYSQKEKRTIRVRRRDVENDRDLAKDIITVATGSGGWGRVDPGTRHEFEYNVSELYDLSRPGKYTIQEQRRGSTNADAGCACLQTGPPTPASQGGKPIVVKSNTTTITVTP